MASLAQILANRRNAEKSTGPQTPKGKAAASQNAVKHGLLGKRDVIRTEDQGEFDSHREQMLAELNPAGPMETVLAERIVSLSWRLKRVERMQNEALDCLLAEDASGPAAESGELGSFVQTADLDGGDPGLALGRVVVKDFAGDRALDWLLVYERRIEHSLYRTISELDRMKLLRPFDADDRIRMPVSAAEGQSCKTNPIWGGVSERGIPCREGGMAAMGRAEYGRTQPNPAGTIDFLPAAGAATMIVGNAREGMKAV
jgi:hypothetical protein